LRLCAYYEVSVVLLDPDEPVSAGARVLSWGVDAMTGALPRLVSSQSTVTFTIPGESAPRAIDVSPGQAAIGDRLTLTGTGLGSGPMELLVRGPGWSAPRAVGSAWGLGAGGDEVSVVVQADVEGDPTVAGTWAASLRLARTTVLSTGGSHTTFVVTNEMPFQIAPAITGFGVMAPTGQFTATGGLFAVPLPAPPLVVRVSILGVALVEVAPGPLQPGEFTVVDAATLELRLPVEAVSGQWAPVRVVINGSESPPAWVLAP